MYSVMRKDVDVVLMAKLWQSFYNWHGRALLSVQALSYPA